MSKSSEPGPAPPIWTLPPPPPRQRALGREEIVASASALADEAGAGALTMKAVAARLGSYSPMALYRYVHSKDGLDDGAAFLAAAARVRDLAEQGGHRLLARWLAAPTGPPADEQFQLGLAFLLDGIAAHLAAPRHRPGSGS